MSDDDVGPRRPAADVSTGARNAKDSDGDEDIGPARPPALAPAPAPVPAPAPAPAAAAASDKATAAAAAEKSAYAKIRKSGLSFKGSAAKADAKADADGLLPIPIAGASGAASRRGGGGSGSGGDDDDDTGKRKKGAQAVVKHIDKERSRNRRELMKEYYRNMEAHATGQPGSANEKAAKQKADDEARRKRDAMAARHSATDLRDATVVVDGELPGSDKSAAQIEQEKRAAELNMIGIVAELNERKSAIQKEKDELSARLKFNIVGGTAQMGSGASSSSAVEAAAASKSLLGRKGGSLKFKASSAAGDDADRRRIPGANANAAAAGYSKSYIRGGGAPASSKSATGMLNTREKIKADRYCK